ncbi:MAG: hypothetical protein ACYDBJ_00545 [Aggregatilineales bacterium]
MTRLVVRRTKRLTGGKGVVYVRTREELDWQVNDLFKWLLAGELNLRIDRTLPLSEAAVA